MAAPHDPPRTADACRSAIGRPILRQREETDEQKAELQQKVDKARWAWVGRRTASADPNATKFAERPSSLLTRSPERLIRLVNPYDASHPLEARARSYLQSNCSSCHVFAGGGNAQIDLEYMTAFLTRKLDAMNAIDVKPLHATFDLRDARLIAAGHPERSVMLARMSRRGPGQMPQLATSIVDEPAVALIREWIATLEPVAAAAPAK